MSSQQDTTFLDVLGILYRQKWVIIVTTLSGCVGIFLFSLFSVLLPPEKSYLPNYYIPQAHVLINESGSGGGLTDLLKSSGLGDLAGLTGIGGGGPTATGLAKKIATTDSFLDTIAGEFDFYRLYKLQENPFPKTAARMIIKSSLSITSDAESGMVTIGYKSIDRELATRIVNRVVELLEHQFAVISVDKNRTQLALIDKKLKEVETESLRIQQEIDALQQRYNTFDLAALAKEQANKIASLRAQLLQKSLEIDSYTQYAGIEDPALRKLKIERDGIKASIEKLERGYQENGIFIPAESDLPDIVLQYTRLKGDLEVKKKIFETLVQQSELVKLQVESVPPTFQVYEKASVPEIKAGPSRAKLCMVVAAASFFFSILLAFIIHYAQRAFKDPRRLRKLKGIPDES